MPKITRLEVQKNNQDRYNIYLDKEFAFGIDEENLVKFDLHKGQELTEEEVERIFEESELYKLYRRALDFLSYRPRSVKETQDYLRKKITNYELLVTSYESEAAIIQSIINRLQRAGYLDDASFVEWWIRQRTESSKPRGIYYVRSELYQKGINGKLAGKIWRELEIDEDALCQKAATKRAHRYNLEDFKERKKLFNYLTRRGFSFDTVKQVVEDISSSV